MATVVVASIVFSVMGYGLYKVIKNARSGGCACGGDCNACCSAGKNKNSGTDELKRPKDTSHFCKPS